MQHDDGGGASRSTDPASGSSAATDVSLREYVGSQIASLDRHITSEINALRRETQIANENAEKAIGVAAAEAKERLAAHNGLIDQMQDLQSTFASRESLEAFKSERQHVLEDFKEATAHRFSRLENFQSKLTGGLLLLSVIGVANLVKVWAG